MTSSMNKKALVIAGSRGIGRAIAEDWLVTLKNSKIAYRWEELEGRMRLVVLSPVL